MSASRVEVARTATATLEALVREQRAHVIWLCRRFRVLSFEDAEDLVADALSRVDGDLPAPLPAARAYLRTMLYRDAIDEVRQRQGRRPSEKAARPQVVPLVNLPSSSGPVSDETADGELAARATRSVGQAAVQRALGALPEDERETVRMRYLDGLEPEAICRGLRLSRTQYERRLTDGIRHALEALVAEAPLPGCHRVRAAIAAAPGRLAAEAAARRDAHLEECLSCRAFERRARGLLALLPSGPALGLWMQLRLKGDGWLHRGAEAAAGAPASDAGATAAASGAAAVGGAGTAGGLSAGGLLAGGAAVKVAAACSSAAVAVVCAVQVAPSPERHERTSDKARAAQASRQAPKPVQPVQPTRASAVVPTPTPTPVARRHAPTDPAPSRADREPSSASRRRERARATSAEFGPESAGMPVADSSQASAADASAAAAAPDGAEPAPTGGGGSPGGREEDSDGSSLSREFAP